MMNPSYPHVLSGLIRAAVRTCGRVALMGLLMQAFQDEVHGAEESDEEKKKIVLPESVEVALRGFVEKLTAAKRRLYEVSMKDLVKALAEESQMKAEEAQKLETGVKAAIDGAMTDWDKKAYEWLSPFAGRSANAAREMARWPVEQIAKSPGVEGVVPPDEQPVWIEFLKQQLTPEQWKRWEEKLARNEQELKARTEEHVAFSADNQKPLMEGEMDLVVADLSNTLSLSEERVNKLKKLAEEAVQAAVEVWKQKSMEALMKMDRERRESIISNGNGGGRFSNEEVVAKDQPPWKEGLAALLSKEEMQQVKEAGEQRLQRRLLATQWAILQILDERVGLTKAQREILLPKLKTVSEELMEQMKRYYNLDPISVAAVLRQTELKALKDVLEAAQQEDLEKLLKATGRGDLDEEEVVAPQTQVVAPPATDEELEALLSSELMKRHRVVWEEKKAEMKTHLDDLERQAGLREEQRLELSLAAIGAVQDSLQMVRQQLGSWLRQSVAGLPVEGIQQRLAILGRAGFGNELEARNTELWAAALERVLDAKQKQHWAAAQAAREEELRTTQRLLVMSELDQQLALTAAQVAFFDAHLKRILIEYAPDLDEYNGARRWHLHAYSVLTPVMGVPEEEIKKHLSAGQMDLWLEKSASQVRHYWEGVKRKHEARQKAAAEATKKTQEAKS
jgi:hypothetical protein